MAPPDTNAALPLAEEPKVGRVFHILDAKLSPSAFDYLHGPRTERPLADRYNRVSPSTLAQIMGDLCRYLTFGGYIRRPYDNGDGKVVAYVSDKDMITPFREEPFLIDRAGLTPDGTPVTTLVIRDTVANKRLHAAVFGILALRGLPRPVSGEGDIGNILYRLVPSDCEPVSPEPRKAARIIRL